MNTYNYNYSRHPIQRRSWWWKYIFNVDTFFVLMFIGLALYVIWKRPKFKGSDVEEWDTSMFNPRGSGWWDAGDGKKKRRKKKTKKKKKPKLNKHEERCREIFQKIYNYRFKSIRPKWLKNPVTGKNLELDGYCPYIATPLGRGLAFEYDGKQHATYVPHFHRHGPQEFLYQYKKDSWKDLKCKHEGVMLVRIPHMVIYEDLERYITNKLHKLGMLPNQDHGMYGYNT